MAEAETEHSLIDDTRELIAEESWVKLLTMTAALHAADLCDLALQLDEEERETLLLHLPDSSEQKFGAGPSSNQVNIHGRVVILHLQPVNHKLES